MYTFTGKIIEKHLSADGTRRVKIECPPQGIPAAGQYLQAARADDDNEVLPVSVFVAAVHDTGFTAAPPTPRNWQPGDTIILRGILGKGFTLQADTYRLALVGLDTHIGRVEPLLQHPALEIAIFTDAALPDLPTQVEVNPISAFLEHHTWADQIFIDTPAADLPNLHTQLATPPGTPLSTAQVLLHTAMPCGVLADCGVCAVPIKGKGGWANACQQGPVFDFDQLKFV